MNLFFSNRIVLCAGSALLFLSLSRAIQAQTGSDSTPAAATNTVTTTAPTTSATSGEEPLTPIAVPSPEPVSELAPVPVTTTASTTVTTTVTPVVKPTATASAPVKPAVPATPIVRQPGSILATELQGFAKNSPAVQQLLTAAIDLSSKGLLYKMGSAKPEAGGMDCSGTMYYILRSVGVKDVPRQSDQQYRWAWEAGTFFAVNGVGEKTFELSRLRPGDLLFWTGTYDIGSRNPPVSHVMIYLGKRISDGKEVMFGASDGRISNGKPSWGVGVFDFRLPTAKSTSRFIGYARVPGLDYEAIPVALSVSIPVETSPH